MSATPVTPDGSNAKSTLSNDDVLTSIKEYLTGIHQSSVDQIQLSDEEGGSICSDLNAHAERYYSKLEEAFELADNFSAYQQARADLSQLPRV